MLVCSGKVTCPAHDVCHPPGEITKHLDSAEVSFGLSKSLACGVGEEVLWLRVLATNHHQS